MPVTGVRPYAVVMAGVLLVGAVFLLHPPSSCAGSLRTESGDSEPRLIYRMEEEKEPGCLVGNILEDAELSKTTKEETLELGLLSSQHR